ncbi:hypothetical protein FQZ97_1272870 [compost metagenome]
MANDPTHIRCCPENVASLHIVEVLHGPTQGHCVAAVVPHHALGLPGCARGVEDVQRVGRLHRHAVRRLRCCHGHAPIDIAAIDKQCELLRALVDDDFLWLV